MAVQSQAAGRLGVAGALSPLWLRTPLGAMTAQMGAHVCPSPADPTASPATGRPCGGCCQGPTTAQSAILAPWPQLRPATAPRGQLGPVVESAGLPTLSLSSSCSPPSTPNPISEEDAEAHITQVPATSPA